MHCICIISKVDEDRKSATPVNTYALGIVLISPYLL